MKFLILFALIAACGGDSKAPNNPAPTPVVEPPPPGTILNAQGESISMDSLTQTGNVVVVFYRGHWCKFCQEQMAELQARYTEFQSRNANIFAVSAKQEDIAKMQEKGISIPLYADPDLDIIKLWNVYDEPNEIAKPAVVVLQDGKTLFAKIGESPDDRPTVDTILANIP